MAFADMISWEARERYLQELTGHLRMDPPPNYLRPTLPQILKADRQVFLHMIRAGVELKRLPDNALDMDTRIFTALHNYEVGFHLLPMPKGNPAKVDESGPKNPAGYNSQKGQTWQQRAQPYKGKGYGGKGKGKGGKSGSLLPKFLLGRGNVNVDAHNRRPCFNFQMGKCSEAPDGGECARGWHLCCRKGCYAPHAEKDRDSKKK